MPRVLSWQQHSRSDFVLSMMCFSDGKFGEHCSLLQYFWRYSRFSILLTARPWAERGLCFTFGLFFLVLSVTRPSPSLGQVLVGTLNHATCNVYSPKAFETLTHENVTHIVFFIVSEIYFLFVLSKSLIQSERTCQKVQGLRHW